MDRTERIELTVLCLIYRNGELLLQNRVKGDWRGFAFPGGHVEPGESIVDAVIREVREETGLTIQMPELCGIKQFPIENGRYLVFLFKTDRFTGKLTSSEEGAVEWIGKDRLAQLQTVADFDQMLRVFEEDALTEFQYVMKNGDWNVILK